MLRPIILMDTEQALSASAITGQADHYLDKFFNNNYNDFIKHYAFLCSDVIDAISIGSGLFGITSIQNNEHQFPGVDHLLNLAKEVRGLVQPRCLITYSSNLNEYHSNDWHNMDKLWAYTDFIGINMNSDCDKLKVDRTAQNNQFESIYASLEKWYFSEHQNPDGTQTDWRPGLKKVWFTECGSIDAVCDSNTILKKKLINYHLKKDISCVDKKFVLGWDVRPQSKQNEYDTAQCLNNKLPAIDISLVIYDIFRKCSIPEKNILIDIDEIEINFRGVICDNQNAKSIVDMLCTVYNLHMLETNGKLICIQDSACKEHNIEYGDVVKTNTTFVKNVGPFAEIPNKLAISYFDKASHCELKSLHVSICEDKTHAKTLEISAPLVLYESEANEIARKLLYKSIIERTEYSFMLPSNYSFISIFDNITLNNQLMKVSELDLGAEGAIKIKAFSIQKLANSNISVSMRGESEYQNIVVDDEIEILDIPTLASEEKKDTPRLFIAVPNQEECSIRYTTREQIVEIQSTGIQSTIGVVLNVPQVASQYVTDKISKLVINLKTGSLESISEEDFLSGKRNIALFGREIIIFQNAKLIDKNKYKIDTLLRGRQGTEKFINTHIPGEKFIILDGSLSPIYLEEKYIKENINIEYMGAKIETKFEAYNLYPLPVSNLHLDKASGQLRWSKRTRGFATSFGYCDAEEQSDMYTVVLKNKLGTTIKINTKNTYADISQHIKEMLKDGGECLVAQISNIVGMGDVSKLTINMNHTQR